MPCVHENFTKYRDDALESLTFGAILLLNLSKSHEHLTKGAPGEDRQNRSKGVPPELPKNWSEQKHATLLKYRTHGSKMGVDI